MSDENQVDIEDTLQDELVDDTVEVSNEDNLEEAATAAQNIFITWYLVKKRK